MRPVLLVVLTLAACRPPCQPDRCGEGSVCGLAGECEAVPTAGSEGEAEEDTPLPRRSIVVADRWGLNDGEHREELQVSDGGERMYLSFPLPVGASSAVLVLHPAPDSTFGNVMKLEARAVGHFERVRAGRLPGPTGGRVQRTVSWQNPQRLDVSDLLPVRGVPRLSLSIAAEGPAPGWRLATPGAADATLRPRLLVSVR
ncbi:MAG: hypothetical protein AAF645_08930 [Myxococcota bacterium]